MIPFVWIDGGLGEFLTCHERRDLLLFYAAGALEPDEQEDLRAHLTSGCATCAGALADAEATLAHLPLALELQSPSPAVRQRLMQRVRESREQPSGDGKPSPAPGAAMQFTSPESPRRRNESAAPRWPWIFIPSTIAAGIAAIVTLAVVRITAPKPPDTRADAMKIQALEMMLTDEQAREARETDWLRASGIKVAQLTGDAGRGHVFWDTDRGQWHLFASNLKDPGAGRAYELWFVTPDRKIPAASFRPTSTGDASVTVEVARNVGSINLAAVTNEPAGPVSQPTPPILLKAAWD